MKRKVNVIYIDGFRQFYNLLFNSLALFIDKSPLKNMKIF